ncbi:plasmid segregation protein ParM domain-containing protein [Variovorax sp. LT1P1]|uniref:plasmid segregation protein ParM domain-containing protein n=1 Tax=Variovorax sp. LT1P1 TaxID=3443730 RepID=UPI003F4617B7
MTEIKASKTTNAPVLVAVDDGYAMTKVVLSNGTKFKMPSLVRTGASSLTGSSEELPTYKTNVGEGTHGEQGFFTATMASDIEAADTRYNDYPYGALNRVMVHHALRQAGLGGQEVEVATSLPVHTFFNQDGQNKVNIARKNESIEQPVHAVAGVPCARVAKAHVFAEGVAAWLDFAISDEGTQRVALESPAAVIDIGGRTTDTVKVLVGMNVEKKASGTINKGVLDLVKAIKLTILRNPTIQEMFGDLQDSQVPRAMVEEVIRTGVFRKHALNVDFSEDVAIARAAIAADIMKDVEQRVAKGFDLQAMLFVGGGSIVFKEEIKKHFATAVFVDEPEFANARGMFKYLKHVIGR